jgi:hypothetical protein
LRRANLAVDLTATLRGRVRDWGPNLRTAGNAQTPLAGKGQNKPAEAEALGKAKPDIANVKKDNRPALESPSRPSAVRPSTAPVYDAEAVVLRDRLVQASPDEQMTILNRLRDNKGPANTEALAAAIPLLKGAVKTKACDALADRLARMTSATLREKLHDPSVEIRRAAALACAMKEDKALIPDLVHLLDEREDRVRRAAQAALKSLIGQDFGSKE